MTAFDATKLFQNQLAKALSSFHWMKVVLLPNPLQESGLIVTLFVKKAKREKATKQIRTRTLNLVASVVGRIESETGLQMALDTIEAVSDFLLSDVYLENTSGAPIPDMRIIASALDDSGILEDPETAGKAWVREEFLVSINLP